MDKNKIKTISIEIQKAYDSKDLNAVIGYYHPEIVLIGPSFNEPVSGLDELKSALERHFNNPQKTSVKLSDFVIQELSENIHTVLCRVDGYQSIYHSRYDFKGWLSRVFTETENDPKIITELLTLYK